MQNAMMQYMPIKSLVSFGVLPPDQVQGLLDMIRSQV